MRGQKRDIIDYNRNRMKEQERKKKQFNKPRNG